jgi:hypothetical protein
MHLELGEGAKPIRMKPYPVVHAQEQVYLQELKQQLCDIGVLTRVGSPDLVFSTFIITKKDGQVQWVVSD